MTCEVHNKEINSLCAELLVRPLYLHKNSQKVVIALLTTFSPI